jgi:hypothetical protein
MAGKGKTMKRKVKKESGSGRVRKAEERQKRIETVMETCKAIAWEFIAPPNSGDAKGDPPLSILEDICPWEDLVNEDDGKWDRLYKAMQGAFGFGYVLGQMLDLPGVDITPVKDFLRERKGLIYVPHEKKAA